MITLLLAIFLTTTQAATTLANGCPSNIPYRYPGNNRCFEQRWSGNMCNVNPHADPLHFQREDPVCQYSDRIFAKKVLYGLEMPGFKEYLVNTICPKSATQMVELYRCDGGEADMCTEYMIFKDQKQVDAYNNYHSWVTPEMWSQWVMSAATQSTWTYFDNDSALRTEMNTLFAEGSCVRVQPSHGTLLANGCPSRLSNRYPGNNRCFENVWSGEMCNVDPERDTLAWQQDDLQCQYEASEVPQSGHVYAYSSHNDCSGGPIGEFQWEGQLGVCQEISMSSVGNDLFPGETKYFKWFCEADVLKAGVYPTSSCSSPVREPDHIPRSSSGDCHVRNNWNDGFVRSHVNGLWYSYFGQGYKFAPGEYPCSGREVERRNLKTDNVHESTSSKFRRLLKL